MKKIVIQVNMECDKCRSKAMKIAAVSQGAKSVSLEGESRDQVVVTGDGIDSVCLTNKLRKKFRHATLVRVEDVIVDPSSNEGGNISGGVDRQETSSSPPMEELLVPYYNYYYYYWNYPPHCPTYDVVYDPYPNYSCSIL